LLADGERAASPVSGQPRFEGVHVQRVAKRLRELAGDRAGGHPLGSLRQRDLSPHPADSPAVETINERIVGLLERRRAGQLDFRLLQCAAHVDARLDAWISRGCAGRAPGSALRADELYGAVAQNLEARPWKS
jgi:hypothetical protein